MWEYHGVNFSCVVPGTDDTLTMFPIIWDIRSTGNIYRDYCEIYNIDPLTDPVIELLDDAMQSGFNTAMMRSELYVIDVPGDYATTDYIFEEVANSIRTTGMDIIVGGFWTNPYTQEHNMGTFNYLADYTEQTAEQYPGDVIGVFGFDEPAVKFLENPETQWDWLQMVADYRDLCELEIGLPFISFISKFGIMGSDGFVYYYNDTTSVLNRFARHLDVVAFNMYPIKNNDRRLRNLYFNTDSLLFCGATDLLPSPSPYYEVYCDRDEFYTVLEEDEFSTFRVFEFICTPGFGHLVLEEAAVFDVPFIPTGVASSDFRACDIGDRSSGEHRPNGAVVLWDSAGAAGDEIVFIFDGQEIVTASLPEFPGSDRASPLAFCVGQGEFRPVATVFEGILGKGDTAVLGCYLMDDNRVCVVVFERTEDNIFRLQTIEPYILKKMEIGGILWGRFWGDAIPTIGTSSMDSGFLIFDDCGSYVCALSGEDDWTFYPQNIPFYPNLFGELNYPVSVFITNEDAWLPPYIPGNDYISAVFEEPESVFFRSRSNGTTVPLGEMSTVPLTGQSGDIISASSYRPDKSYGDALLCTVDGTLLRSDGTITNGVFEGLIELQSLGSSTGPLILPGARVMDTRRNIRAGLVLRPEGLVMPAAEIYWSVWDDYKLNWFTECFEVAMENGVLSTLRNNCAFSNIQAYGRHAFGLPSYCASQDTMLWMVTLPVIKGCRGMVFYAMDLALMSGNMTNEGILRYPNIMQNWGPSRDVGNIDLPGRIHHAVASLTGNGPGGGPDFLSATIDTNFRVLPPAEAINCTINSVSGVVSAPSDTTLNFIALENQRSGTMLILVSNESGAVLEEGRGICFPQRYSGDYTLSVVDGFSPIQRTIPNTIPALDILTLADWSQALTLDFSGMPSITVSLLELRSDITTSETQNSAFMEVRATGGAAWVRFNVTDGEMSELVLYDLAGRKVKTIWSGVGFPGIKVLALPRNDLPSGIYFVTLVSGEFFISRKVTLLN